MDKKNTLIIHYAGGCGINIGNSINDDLKNLGGGFCSVSARYLDTSTNNINKAATDFFWKVESDGFNTDVVAGSGGERRSNSSTIVASIKEYLSNLSYTGYITGEFHIVMFSAAGGTGSVIGPVLIRSLRDLGIPVIGVVIGDSSNSLNCTNTLNTIATLDNLAKTVVKKPITVMYYNNFVDKSNPIGKRENIVNHQICRDLKVLSLFLSGLNEDIDSKDMDNFISPDNYDTITVNPSLYSIVISTKDKVINDTGTVNIIGRTLSVHGKDTLLDLTLLHHKYGMVLDENAIKEMKDIVPVHMVLVGNALSNEHKMLSNTVVEYDSVMNAISTEDLSGKGSVDEDGLVL